MKKSLLALVLVLTLMVGFFSTIFAEEGGNIPEWVKEPKQKLDQLSERAQSAHIQANIDLQKAGFDQPARNLALDNLNRVQKAWEEVKAARIALLKASQASHQAKKLEEQVRVLRDESDAAYSRAEAALNNLKP